MLWTDKLAGTTIWWICGFRQSLRLSVTLVDQDHIGWKSWKLIARGQLVQHLALRSPKAIHIHGEILGRVEVGWEMACWSTRAAISLKRVKIEEQLLWRAYRYHPPPCTPSSFPRFPKIEGSEPPPKSPIANISGIGKATNFTFGRYIHRHIRTKARYKFWRKGSVGVSRDCPIF